MSVNGLSRVQAFQWQTIYTKYIYTSQTGRRLQTQQRAYLDEMRLITELLLLDK